MNQPPTIPWIIFDAVGTLIEPTPSVAEAYWSIGQQLGSQISLAEVGRRFRKKFAGSHPQDETEHASSEAIELARWEAIVRHVLDDVRDQKLCFQRVHRHFSKPEAWQVFNDVEETFQRLKNKGYRLAIGSNFDQRLYDVCRGHSEFRSVDAAFASAELGYRKPSPKFYAELAKRLETLPSRMLMVGDDLENDVIAAERAGLKSILIDRPGDYAGPYRSIQQLTMLPQVL